MKYKIYELIKPEHLQKHVPDGYHMTELTRFVLEEPKISGLYDFFDSMLDAKGALDEHGESYTNYTILPHYYKEDE